MFPGLPLCCCILCVFQYRTVGRPGNEASYQGCCFEEFVHVALNPVSQVHYQWVSSHRSPKPTVSSVALTSLTVQLCGIYVQWKSVHIYTCLEFSANALQLYVCEMHNGGVRFLTSAWCIVCSTECSTLSIPSPAMYVVRSQSCPLQAHHQTQWKLMCFGRSFRQFLIGTNLDWSLVCQTTNLTRFRETTPLADGSWKHWNCGSNLGPMPHGWM